MANKHQSAVASPIGKHFTVEQYRKVFWLLFAKFHLEFALFRGQKIVIENFWVVKEWKNSKV